ncbi:unnamed protein product [Paramecium octaurelia]|uniref:Uncharacterized protein n=1 Tax=Paramecium octaurelia TaxID=43137 RepID=A0A8S1SHA7_PAROT|nr:unnamed protein product [Paramecium octaurelia]
MTFLQILLIILIISKFSHNQHNHQFYQKAGFNRLASITFIILPMIVSCGSYFMHRTCKFNSFRRLHPNPVKQHFTTVRSKTSGKFLAFPIFNKTKLISSMQIWRYLLLSAFWKVRLIITARRILQNLPETISQQSEQLLI